VFKVANGKLAKHKGKAKEVTTKLKNVSYMIDMILIYFTLLCTVRKMCSDLKDVKMRFVTLFFNSSYATL
jgi:hypothetical protein